MNRIIILSLLALANCAASGPQYHSANDGQSRVVVYRPDSIHGMFSVYWIELNGVEVCKLSNASYVVSVVPPGHVSLASSRFGYFGTTRADVDVKAGQTAYVKMEVNVQRVHSGILGGVFGRVLDGPTGGPIYLNEINSDIASYEMRGLRQDCQ